MIRLRNLFKYNSGSRNVLRVYNSSHRYPLALNNNNDQSISVSLNNNSNNNNNNNNNYKIRFYSTQNEILDENAFHDIVDVELELFVEKFEEIGQDLDLDDFDVESAAGVLTLKLGSLGTYVINKQTPNRQIWWSSPISGPKRFDYDSKSKQWLDNKDANVNLRSLIKDEINQLCKYNLKF
ncbi:hypothetical protein CYY_005772 [Polysphondylium violaceum]|uniref:ferroxidase n=1 Tax=Polysphondylium violaceum TaxID=133409 RepID=A0A8J4UYJ5_9MYCE|nr:hypothetical protein CYY_005772 [Polysphondylium violaceum]